MLGLKTKKPCPHCGELIDINKLIKVPSNQKSKWYQRTPEPDLACYTCNGLVKNTGADSPWILVCCIPMLLLVGLSYFIDELKVIFEIPWGFGVWIWMFFCIKKVYDGSELIKK